MSAGAIFGRALKRAGYGSIDVRVIGRGASAWSPVTREALASRRPGGIVVTDLGVQAGDLVPGVPTVLVDHHVPRSLPESAETTGISGHEDRPIPTASLLAHACAEALGEADDLAWLAAIGLIGDLGERGASSDFPDVIASVRKTYTAKSLREAVSLLNAP